MIEAPLWPEAVLPAEQASPSEEAMRRERTLELAEAIDSLPEAQQEAVVLRFLRGLSVDEIADRIDRTPIAVAGLLRRGLKGIRERLDRAER